MNKLDKASRDTLKTLYREFENVGEVSVSSPKYKKTVVDYLVDQGFIEKIDASTLSGWAYIVRPTHAGELAFGEILKLKSTKIEAFIERGEVIMKEEYHRVTDPGLAMPDYISGPKSDQWFSEIKIFNDRYLSKHPLHDKIDDVCSKHKRAFSPHEDMMGYLRALLTDDEYLQDAYDGDRTTDIIEDKGDVIVGKHMIFISHRSDDAEVADMLKDYLVGTGIPNDCVFCSSLPGNDVAGVISKEVKEKIQASVVNIAILSHSYYQSAYCLNEAGIFWFNDSTPVIAIGLPEITHENMYGFLNSDYKLRRLDNETDISQIYDTVSEVISGARVTHTVITRENQKLRDRYSQFLTNRGDLPD